MVPCNNHTLLLPQIVELVLDRYAVVACYNGPCCSDIADEPPHPDTHKTLRHNSRLVEKLLVEEERSGLGVLRDRTPLHREHASAESCCWLHLVELVAPPCLRT